MRDTLFFSKLRVFLAGWRLRVRRFRPSQWHRWQRAHRTSYQQRIGTPFSLEPLESRLLLAADLSGVITATTQLDPGVPTTAATATVQVRNQGDAQANATTQVAIYASADATLDSSDVLLGTANTASLNVGQSRNVTVNFGIPNSLTPGSYNLLARVDATNIIAEGPAGEANNISVRTTAFTVAWQFGNVPGRSGNTTLTLRDADGTRVTFRLTGPGLGEVIRDGAAWDVKVTGTSTSSNLTISTNTGGNDRVLINDVHVFGPIGSFTAPRLDLSGTLAIDGTANTLAIGDATGGVIAAQSITSFSARNLISTNIYIGTTLGQDGKLGGLGTAADTYGQGRLQEFVLTGSMVGSTVRVGVNPVDGNFGNGNDAFFRNGPTGINSVTIGESISSDSRFIARNLPEFYQLAGRRLLTNGDNHFSTDPNTAGGPRLIATLQQDTGVSATDRLTNNPTVVGTVTDPQRIRTFTAGFGATPTFNILGDRQSNGTFTLSTARLEQINGGLLTDGVHTLILHATDTRNNATQIALTFRLDRTAPTTLTLDLDAASDTPPLGDHQTTAGVVTLAGQTEANALVELVGLGRTATASGDGFFSVANVSLALGANAFTVRATDLAGNIRTIPQTITRVSSVANQFPLLNTIGNRAIGEGQPLSFTATASDPDAGQTLTFSLDNGTSGLVPAGASINPTTGVFAWTPSEVQGPGTVAFDVVVTDNGSPNLSDRETITVTVGEVNQQPTLDPITAQTVTAGQLLSFTAVGSDGDVPANTLTYSLQGTVPAGASINPTTGAFTWTPTAGQVGPHSLTLRVTDNGSPTLFAEQTVSITVSSVNQAPIAVNDTFTMTEGGVLSGTPFLVKDINPGTGNSNPTNLVNVNGTLFFTASTPGLGVELWRSDGTAAGTVLVKDVVAGTGSSNPAQLTNVNGTLFFTVDDGVNGRELWKSDGTAAGTVMVKDINPGSGSGFSFLLTDTLLNLNGTLFFTANDGVNGVELWKSDGTAAGTVMVRDIRAGANSSSPAELTEMNGTLFFTASDGISGTELWKSDGTAAGTLLVKDISSGGSTGFIQAGGLTNVNGTLFFAAGNPEVELWKSDGTAAGTVLVANLNGALNSFPRELTNVNGTLFFTAATLTNGTELLKSDGTAAGTVVVKDIVAGTGGSSPDSLTYVGGKLFFRVFDSVIGQTLWVSDGTAAGTLQLAPGGLALPGAANGSPLITDVNGTAFFRAGGTGNDLWKSDGTLVGTVPVGAGLAPQGLTSVNGTLFFTGTPGGVGRELMKVNGEGNVLANDSDPNGDPLTAILVSGPTNGTLTLNPNGMFNYTPNSGFTGTDTFTYKANDGSLDSNVATVTITVTAAPVVNQAPTLNAIGTQTVDEGQPLSFTATASDPNAGQTLTFSLANGTSGLVPAGASINPTTGAFTWTPTEAQGPGPFTFDVVVTDNGSPSLSDRETITVTVGEVNQAPTLDPIAAQTVTAGQVLSFTAVGSDNDVPANTLTYSLEGTIPTGASLDPNTGAFTWTPTVGQVGPHSVTLRVTDNGSPNLFAEQVVSVTVEAIPNQAPTLNAIGNQTISEHLPFPFTATASDPDAGQTLTFSLANGTSGLVPAGASINPTTGLFSWTPTEAQGPSTFTFDVVVTDNGNPALSDRETITITVTEANAAPVLLTGSVPVGQVDSPLTPVGPVGNLVRDILKLAPGSGPGTFNVSDSDAGAVTGMAISTQGTLPLWYSLDNGTTWTPFSSNLGNVRLLAADANTRLFVSPPSIDFAGTRVNEFLFQAWDRTVGTNGGVITTGTLTGPTGAFSTTFAQATVIFIEDQVTNQAPVLAAIGNRTVDEGQALSFTATANDPNAGQTLTFSLANGTNGLVPAGASINPTTGVFSWTPTEVQGPGTFTFDVVVTDNGSPTLSDRETLTVTVGEVNQQPTLEPITAQTVTAGQLLSFTAVGSDNDVPANSLTYSLQGTVPVGASLDPNTGAFTWTPTAGQVGPHSLTLRVTDNGSPNLFAEQVVSITVEAIPNQAPTLNAIGNQTISEHLPFTFTATATDADAGQTLTFSLANGTSGLVPAGASIDPTTGLFSWTPTESQGPGTFTFDVVVTDNGSPTLSDRETLTVTVNEANAAPVLLRSSVPIGQVDSPLTPVGAVGTLVSAIADLLPPAGGADSVSDSDAGAVTGIAVSTQAGLPLWYSLDNGATWTPFSSNLSNVRLLAADANTRLFVSPPSIDFAGSRANEFLFQAWDQTVGTNGGVITTGTLTGPTGAFSATFAQATVIFIEDQVTNQAPVLAAIGNQSIDEGQPLTFTATATDANAGQTLTFSLDNGTSGQVPAGATINATTGVFTWTPTEAQGPGTFTFDVVVTDNGSPALSDRETITVTVGEVNQAPTLAPISDQTVTAGQLLSFTAVGSDLDLPANALIYSLQGTVPVGASIDPDTGAFTWTPTADQVGSHSLTLRVTDNGSPTLFAEQVVSVTVEAIPNQAPVLTAIGNQTISEHLPFTFTATASDADAGQTLTFSLANGTSGAIPAGATINPTTGVFTWTPIEAQGPGTFTFDVVVTDNGSAVLTDRETLTVTVTEANAAPVLLRGSVPIGQVDSPLTPVGPVGRLISEIADLVPPTGGADSVSDSDAGAVTGIAISLSAGLPLWYSLDNGTTWVGFSPSASNVRLLAADASTRLFVSPPSIDFAGSRLNEFTFQAWDRTVGSNGGVITTGTLTGTGPTGAFSSSFAQATVIFIEDQVTNQAPVLAAIGNQTIDEGQPLSFTATASDPNAGQTLAFSLANGTSGLVPLGASINPTTGAFSWTPTEAQGPGTFTFDVVVTDNGSPALSDRETITITVTEANAAPVLNVVATPTLVVDEDAPGPVGAVGTLISTLVDMNPPAGGLDNVTDLDAAAVTGVAIVGRNSSFNWFYSLNGGSSWTAFGSAGQGPSSALLLAADSLTRIYAQPNVPNMTGSDFFGFDFRAWDQTSGTNGGTVNTAGAIGGAGTFSVNVDSVRVTINSANDAPVLSSIGSQSIDEGQLLTFTATANDPDAGQMLTFSLANGTSGQIPAGASINPTTGAFAWTPTESQGPGTFTFDVVVTDNGSPNLSDRETLTVTVGDVNQQPTLDPIAAQTVTAGQLLSFTAVGSDTDVPANSLTYSLQGTVPAGASIDPNTGVFSWTPTADQVGSHSLTLRVTDNGSPTLFAEQVVSIAVASSNQAPTAGDDAFTVQEGSNLVVGTTLVKDIFPGSIGSSLTNLTNVNGTVFFVANDGSTGRELWTSDGTAQGTALVKEINTNPGGFDSHPEKLTNVNGTVFFMADDGVHGNELWKSDGTAAGTVLVKDIRSGTASSMDINLTELVNVNGTLFFTAGDGVTSIELWKSDGTEAGTVLVKDIWVGNGSLPRFLTNVNGTLFFEANDGINGRELWKSDGTAAGTVLVKDINPGSADSRNNNLTAMANVNGTLFFSADNGVNGIELWKSDGTQTGTVLVKDIVNGGGTPGVDYLTAVNATLFFQADDGVNGRELWKSDGTAAGTVLVKDINPSGSGLTTFRASMISVGGVLYLPADDGVVGTELWKSDGTEAGTVLVKDINVGIGASLNGSDGVVMANVNGTLFLSAADGIVVGNTLWKSDGIAAGTVRVEVSGPGSFVSAGTPLVNVDGTLFFPGFDFTHGLELWKSGGSQRVLANDTDPNNDPLTAILVSGPSNGTLTLNADGTFNYQPNSGFTGTDTFTYKANDGSLDSNVATVTITVTAAPVVNQAPTLNAIGNQTVDEGQPLNFTATASDPDAGQTLTFSLENGASGSVPAGASINPTIGAFSWTPTDAQGPGSFTFDVVVTDNGSPALSDRETITVTVGEVNQQPTLDPIAAQTVTAGQLLTFTAVGSDGDVPANSLTYSLQGTVPVGATINSTTGAFSWTPTAGQVGPHSLTVRVTDNGTPAVFAEQVVNITVAAANQAPTAVDDSFTVTEGGSLSGVPLLVKDINPGSPGAFPTSGSTLVNVNGTVYFAALVNGQGTELWKSDGTAAGTVLVKDMVAGTGSSSPAQLTNVNGTLFFTVDDGVNGRELWKSDGTAAGTVMVKDINPGSGYGFSFLLTDTLINLNGTLFFTANDGANGVELWKSDGTAAGTVMVRDIRAGANSSSPAELTEMNGTLFFTASDGISGTELWKSDGTAAGTVLVKDISTGGFSASPDALTNVNGSLFFSATDGFERELWKSNGTAAGTVLVKNLNGGGNSNPAGLTNVNGTLFFQAVDVGIGVELFKSDGTAAGTVLVKDITPGTGSSTLTDLTNVGGTLFFRGPKTGGGLALWVSDGTAAGTIELAPGGLALPGLANVGPFLTEVNGMAFFSAGGTGNDLWKSDGTVAGTVPVGTGLAPQGLTTVGGTLFFTGTPGGVGRELMKVDGEANVLGNDSDPDGNPLTAILVSGPTNGALTLNADGTVSYTPNAGFSGTDTFTYKANDGALDSNVATVTITVTAAPVTNQAPTLNAVGNQTVDEGQQLSFTATASDPNAGQTLTFSLDNGTSGLVPAGASINPTTGVFSWTPTEAQGPGTFTFDVVVTDNGSPALSDRETITVTVNEVNQAPVLNAIGNQAVNEGALLSFTAPASDGDLPANALIYSLQGTVPAGASIDPNTGAFTWTPTAGQIGPHSLTVRVTDNGSPALFDEETITITVNDVNVTPTATNDSYTVQQGSALVAGTLMVKNIAPSNGNSAPSLLTNVDGTLFFQAQDGVTGAELWKSDGTATGTVLVKDINTPNVIGGSHSLPQNLLGVNETLFFTATDPVNGRELWKSDGTATGTALVKDIGPGSNTSDPIFLTNVNGTLFFTASDGVNGRELWKSDGTEAGTMLVKDIRAGGSSDPQHLTNVNGTLFFTASDGVSGQELWKSDGTAAGTVLVKDINPGTGDSAPINLTNVNGTLFFRAFENVSGPELWKSDGTAAGTVLVKDINPGTGGSASVNLTNVNGTLFFMAGDGVNGFELWKSDGTAAGTVLVKDVNTGPNNSSPDRLVNVNGTLFFAADDGTSGRELWKSDGTATGTMLVKDINPGTPSAFPSSGFTLLNVNGTLFFAANDGVSGRELWKSDGSAAGTILVKDIFPGSGNSVTAFVTNTNINGTLFFMATDGTNGQELWASGLQDTLLSNDTDPDSPTLTATLGTGPSNGSLILNPDGTFTYRPNVGYTGTDTFTYTVSDGTTTSNVATVTITVT